jgi:hypothetical protein
VVSLLAVVLALPGAGAAQVAANRNARYQFASDPGDARVTWINPGALGVQGTLSVNADLTFGLEAPYNSGTHLQQLSLGFNSHFLAFAYQFDRLEDQIAGGFINGHTYRLALAGFHGRLGLGGAASVHRGGSDGGTAYDVGLQYRMGALVDVGLVAANIGQPTVRGTALTFTWRPALTLRVLGEMIAAQAQSDIERDGVRGYAFGARVGLGRARSPLRLSVRLDTDDELRRQAFAFGLTFGGENRGAAVFTAPGDLSSGEAISIHGISERAGRRR